MALIFLSYSHRDEHFRRQVSDHFGVLARHHRIEAWTDRRIHGGDRWRDEIKARLMAADMVVLLVSQHSLTSDFILDEEVEPAIAAVKRVYPILVRDCDWKGVGWLSELQMRPEGPKSLASMKVPERDRTLAAIAQEIRTLVARTRRG
ncbi:MAG: toll/interleukin-1 receptor domain-containing protein [Hyphomicrobiaceae bacterium]